MSDDLSRASGAGPTITWKGKTWTVRGRTVGYVGQINAEIIARRGDPFDMLVNAAKASGMTPEALAMLCHSVSQHFRGWSTVTHGDFHEFCYRSMEGEAFQVWLSLRENDGNLTVDEVLHELTEAVTNHGSDGLAWKHDILNKIDQASGGGDLGNLTGPQSKGATETQPGDSSTAA